MARETPTGLDTRLAGVASSDAGQAEFTAANQTTPGVTMQAGRFCMAAFAGTVAPVGGQVALECSFDAGTTWLNVSQPSGADNLWAVPVVQFPEVHPERNVQYRLRCVALTSGRIAWRLSQ